MNQRTPEEVMEARKTSRSCCERRAGGKGCGCMTTALAVAHRKKIKRLPKRRDVYRPMGL